MCLVTFGASAGCEGPPARAKSWRAAAEPTAATAEAPSAGPERAPTDDDSRRAHTLRIQLPVEPGSLDPLVEPDREALEVSADTIFETLIRDGTGGLQPALAESFRVTDGGAEIRFALRAGVTFHDGKPFTAADAQFSIDAARRAGSRNSRLRAVLADVTNVELWGPRDLRVVLRHPSGYALRALAEVPMLPAAVYGSEATRPARARAPVGTGPYRLARWTKGERLVLERFPGYWGPAPAVETIEMLIVPDGARALTLAKQGKIDILPALIPEHWPLEAESPGVTAAFVPIELAPARFLGAVFNQRRAPFDDERVRHAAVLLVDRWRLARDAWRGLARPVAGPVWPGGPGDADAPEPPLFDPLWAARLLEDAGWVAGKDGLRSRNGVKLKVVLLAGGAGAGEPEALVTNLRRGGFLVDLRVAAGDDLVARSKSGDFDLVAIDYRGRTDEDLTPLVGSGGAKNLGGFARPDVDEALAACAVPWEPAERQPLVAELGRRIAADLPLLPLVRPTPHGLVARRVHGLVAHDGWFAIRDLTLD